MSAPEFTEDELATLRRFEAAPFAPEAKYLDCNILVPTGEIRPAHEVVPAPDFDGTAAQWSTHYLAQAHAAHGLGLHLMRQMGDIAGAPVADIQEMADAYADFAHLFAVGYLLRHVSDDVARELAEVLELGDNLELTYEWLDKAGVAAEHIRSEPSRSERVAAVEARRATQERA